MKPLKEYLQHLPAELVEQLEEHGIIKEIPAETEIMREGQYVKMVPLVLEGAVKVFTRHQEKELLLYYIENGESCIMSFNAALKNNPSKLFAITEEESLILLIPSQKIQQWVKTMPSINELFFKLYDQRYASLLDTINHLLYNRLDQRLYNYLVEKGKQKNSRMIHIRHRQIAAELGTVREVISRVMKKLEQEGKIRQHSGAIEIM